MLSAHFASAMSASNPAMVAVTNGRLDGSTEGFDRTQPRAAPKSLASGRGSLPNWTGMAEAGVDRDGRGVGAYVGLLDSSTVCASPPADKAGACNSTIIGCLALLRSGKHEHQQ